MYDKKKILIIDDETDLCMLLKDYFIRQNFEVVISHTLSEGLSILNGNYHDILFLDNNLPDGEGWEHAPAIAHQFPHTYIVLISAFHPVIPVMPPHAHFSSIEKPISLADLNKQFSLF
jgi:DNA-binding response OmpR family regulator